MIWPWDIGMRRKRMFVPSKRRQGHVTQNMCTYWRKVMNTFVDFVASRECERVVIGPPRNDVPPNWCLIPNIRLFQHGQQGRK